MENQEQKIPGLAYMYEEKWIPSFPVRKSANAWWMDRVKIQFLIQAFKRGFNVQQACQFTGITLAQYKYFVKKHPEYLEAEEACTLTMTIHAKNNLYELLKKGDGRTTRYIAERLMPEKYALRRLCPNCKQLWYQHRNTREVIYSNPRREE